MYSIGFLTLLLTARVDLVSSYSGGAPGFACSDLNPSGHGASVANGAPPYNLTISSNNYKPGDVLKVTLACTGGATFTGFLLIAKRVSGDTTSNIGTFSAVSNTQVLCPEPLGNGVTHTDKSPKTSFTFDWTAPASGEGDIVFHYTVVRGNYTADQKRDFFKDLKSSVVTGPQLAPGQFPKDQECGKTKGCYSNCVGGVCDWEATWSDAIDELDITLKSAFNGDNKYVALGFSDSPGMANASVVSCVAHNGKVEVLRSYNPGHSNQPLANATEGISNQNNSCNNGILQCSFSHEKQSTDPQIFNLTEPWYIITARGDAKPNGTLNKHDDSSAYHTDSKIDLSNITDASFTTPSTTPQPQSSTAPTPAPGQFPKDQECGKTKGCYSNCVGGVCGWEATWSDAGDELDITLKSAFNGDNKYVALGFSDSPGMAKASVVSCVAHNGKVEVLGSYNPTYSNMPFANATEGISNQNNSYNNGILQCSFSHEKENANPLIFNLTEPWYIITARGDAKPDGTLIKHDESSAYHTDSKIDLSNATDASFTTPTTTPRPLSTTAPLPASKFTKDPACGKTKGCYSNCNNDKECDLLLAWAKQGDLYEITLKSGFGDTSGDHYIAIGFSSKNGMYPASVVGCTIYNSKVSVAASFNPSTSNSPLPNPQEGLSNLTGSFINGVLDCTFRRQNQSPNNSKIYNLDDEYYLITARGKARGDGILSNHGGKERYLTSSKINFKDPTVDISLETTKYPLIKAHACLMVLAWMLSASIGIALARFFKKQWPDSKVCDVKIWFAVHRTAMVMAFLMGITAFILIFVEVKGYSEIVGADYKKAHPILGIITTVFLFINPFMSLLRCAPDHPHRPIFNWAHYLVGTSGHILSGVTITLGLYLPKAQVDKDLGLIIMIIYFAWHVVFFILMSILDYMSNNSTSKTGAREASPIELTSVIPKNIDNRYDLNASTEYNKDGSLNISKDKLVPSEEVPSKSGAKKVLLFFHVTIMAGLAITMVYLIIDGDA